MHALRVPVFLVFLSCSLAAQDRPQPPHVVRASATATIPAKPDRAQISIGVVCEAPTAQQASAQNAEQTAQALTAVKRILGSAGQVQTTGYFISPNFQYPKGGGTPKITGYRASNTVEVTVTDLSLVGKLADAATASGANNIGGISYILHDDGPIRAQALAQAAVKARANAEAIARALGLQVIGVLDAETAEAPVIRPMMRNFAAAQSVQVTPVEPGNIDIDATVTVSLEVR